MNNKSFSRLALAAAVSSLLVACGGDDDNDNNSSMRTMTLNTTYLDPLGDDYDYEGWLIVNGNAISTGTFDMENGQTVPASFQIDPNDADQATTFVLTIEPEVNDPPAPSDVHIVAGNMENGTTRAITNHPAALNTDFADATGKFILATPTNDASTADQGIWFLDNSGGTMVAGLELPTLPAGWKYEGWVVGAQGPITTGTFTSVNGRDDDGAGPTKGPNGDGPAYPGQDYIDPAIMLNGYKAVITVEPDPDNSSAPFSIKPLIADIDGSLLMTPQDMENRAAMSLPVVDVAIK